MQLALQIVLIVSSVLLVLLILLHRGRGGGLSSLFGGGVQSSLSGSTVVEKNLIRSDLHIADELFMCGTAAEVTPIREIDDIEIGVGEITKTIQKAYLDTANGVNDRWAQWREPVENFARAEA